MVLTPIPPSSEAAGGDVDMEDSSNTADPADNSWLLSHLPSLPCFGDFYPHISSSLRSACQARIFSSELF